MIIRSDGKVYKTIEEAVEDTGIKKGNIKYCLQGKRKSAGGFGWNEAEKKEVEMLGKSRTVIASEKPFTEGQIEAAKKIFMEDVAEPLKKDVEKIVVSTKTKDLEVEVYKGTNIATEKSIKKNSLVKSDYREEDVQVNNENSDHLFTTNDIELVPESVLEALDILGVELIQGLKGDVFAEFKGNSALKTGWITLQDLAKKHKWKNGKTRGYSRYRQLISGMPKEIKARVGNTNVVKEKQAIKYIEGIEGK